MRLLFLNNEMGFLVLLFVSFVFGLPIVPQSLRSGNSFTEMTESYWETLKRFVCTPYPHTLYQHQHLNRVERVVNVYVALRPNMTGVSIIENYVLQHSSNPYSHLYGRHLTNKQIDTLVAHENIDETVKMLSHLRFYCSVYSSTTLYCHVTENDLDEYLQRLEPLLSSRIDFIERENVKPFEKRKRLYQRSYPSWLMVDDTKVARGFISREQLLRTYMRGQSGFLKNRTSLGVIEFLNGEGFSQRDMVYVQTNSSVVANTVPQSHIIGYDAFPPDGESELDMSVVWQAAANADLWYQDFPGWLFGWTVDLYNRSSSPGQYPEVVSLSWGWDEDKQCVITKTCKDSKAYVERTNIEFMKLAARGITVVVASGDAGSPGRTNELCDTYRKPMNPIYPGSSPWVLTVGATYLEQSNANVFYNRYTSDVCTKRVECVNVTNSSYPLQGSTTFMKTGWTSGAGFSNYASTPEWQRDFVEKYLSKSKSLPNDNYFNRKGRAYPDVSAYGHNLVMYDNGWSGGDGTSASAPLMAGIVSYLNGYRRSQNKSTLGFVNPLFYKMYSQNRSTFQDIYKGDSACTEQMCCKTRDFGFLPLRGEWDVVSGLGTPNVDVMVKFLNNLLPRRHILPQR